MVKRISADRRIRAGGGLVYAQHAGKLRARGLWSPRALDDVVTVARCVRAAVAPQLGRHRLPRVEVAFDGAIVIVAEDDLDGAATVVTAWSTAEHSAGAHFARAAARARKFGLVDLAARLRGDE